MSVLVKRMYQYLMDKHGWTIDQIDSQDFFLTLDLLNSEFEQNGEGERLMYIDEVFGT